MANRKQQKRKYLRAVGRGRVPAGTEPPQPSAARAAKRAAVFAVLFYLVITYTSLGGTMTTGVKLFNGIVMFVLFWSIGTITETFAWRRWQKKHGNPGS